MIDLANLEEAELILYDIDGKGFEISLNELQLFAILKTIGFQPTPTGYAVFTNETLKEIIEQKKNAFAITEFINPGGKNENK